MEKKEKRMNGLQIRLVVAAFAFLCVLGINQVEGGKIFSEQILSENKFSGKIRDVITSNEDIYRLEDKIVLWYNGVISQNKEKNNEELSTVR